MIIKIIAIGFIFVFLWIALTISIAIGIEVGLKSFFKNNNTIIKD